MSYPPLTAPDLASTQTSPVSPIQTNFNANSKDNLMSDTEQTDPTQYQRRFQGTQTLYGTTAFDVFAAAHVIVIGIGGVGSWVAEGLARTAVGTMTLIDLDVLVASNVNRQLPALDSTFGQSKIAAMGARVSEINPRVQLHLVDDLCGRGRW